MSLSDFHKNFKEGDVYLEDSVLWYCIDWNVNWYKSLDINARINFKESFYDPDRWERLFTTEENE